jgi:hypothetical protein
LFLKVACGFFFLRLPREKAVSYPVLMSGRIFTLFFPQASRKIAWASAAREETGGRLWKKEIGRSGAIPSLCPGGSSRFLFFTPQASRKIAWASVFKKIAAFIKSRTVLFMKKRSGNRRTPVEKGDWKIPQGAA